MLGNEQEPVASTRVRRAARDRALVQALELAAAARLSATLRRLPLPDGVLDVIRIAAGCEETLDRAAATCRMQRNYVKSAAEHYVLQILLYPGADCYRALGVREEAPREEARRYLRWLLMWLHPDRSGTEWRTAYTPRVLAARREIDPGRAPPAPIPKSSAHGRMIILPNRSHRGQAAVRRRPSVRSIRWSAVAAVLFAILILFAPSHWDVWEQTQVDSLIAGRPKG